MIVGSCWAPEPELEFVCVAPIVGKVVSTHPACAGLVVQVIKGGYYDSLRLQSEFTDSYGNTFNNVFWVSNPCELDDEGQEWLSDPDNIGVEFTFIVRDDPSPDTCGYCKIFVKLPEVHHRITLVPPDCNDVITIDD
jgi:hypothetical protein